MNNNWYKKEKPLLGLTGLGGGVDGLSVVGAETKAYIEDVFSNYLYTGTGSSSGAAQTITNGIDLAGKGGLVMSKVRNKTYSWGLTDTVRGVNKFINSDTNNTETTTTGDDQGITSFNDNGFSLGKDNVPGIINYGGDGSIYTTNTFRKQKGFFDVVKYTPSGGTNTISHSLGCVPGMILVKNLDNSENWAVFHRGMDSTDPNGYGMKLNTDGQRFTGTGWNVTATTFDAAFSLNNNDGDEHIAYLFAGGASTAATAKSVDFDGSSYLAIGDNSDFTFGTDDFTMECWYKADDLTLSNDWDYIFSSGWPVQFAHTSNSGSNSRFTFYMSDGNTSSGSYFVSDLHTGNGSVEANQWYHVAVTRSGSTFRIFLNGELKNTATSSSSAPAPLDDSAIGRFTPSSGGNYFYADGRISNFRYVKGTAVYTSSFRPPTEPLTNITNTKLLCCNNSSVTGSTVTPGTITNNGATAITDIPFDDPEGFKFGADEDQNIIKTGSYVGNGSIGHKIELGWEPSWIMFKRATGGTADWEMCDVMRGNPANDGSTQNASFLRASTSGAEFDNRPFAPYATGFEIRNSGGGSNASGSDYIYTAIRRPDGYVGKPVEDATKVFAMDYGNASTTIPAFDSGFPVDFGLIKVPTTATDWTATSRLQGSNYVVPNDTAAETAGSAYVWDSNVGYTAVSWADSNMLSWMFKRHAGLDIVCYKGNGSNTDGLNSHAHSLGKTPEMIWIKTRSGPSYSGVTHWTMSSKNLNGGTNPWQYSMSINNNWQNAATSNFGNTAPTSTHFYVGDPGNGRSNGNGDFYIAMLFASVKGISHCGTFTGNGSTQTITIPDGGFQPRFLIMKCTSHDVDWQVLDTTRGWASGTDSYSELNTNAAQYTNIDFGEPTSTGFTLTQNAGFNGSGRSYIYYAHA